MVELSRRHLLDILKGLQRASRGGQLARVLFSLAGRNYSFESWRLVLLLAWLGENWVCVVYNWRLEFGAPYNLRLRIEALAERAFLQQRLRLAEAGLGNLYLCPLVSRWWNDEFCLALDRLEGHLALLEGWSEFVPVSSSGGRSLVGRERCLLAFDASLMSLGVFKFLDDISIQVQLNEQIIQHRL